MYQYHFYVHMDVNLIRGILYVPSCHFIFALCRSLLCHCVNEYAKCKQKLEA